VIDAAPPQATILSPSRRRSRPHQSLDPPTPLHMSNPPKLTAFHEVAFNATFAQKISAESEGSIHTGEYGLGIFLNNARVVLDVMCMPGWHERKLVGKKWFIKHNANKVWESLRREIEYCKAAVDDLEALVDSPDTMLKHGPKHLHQVMRRLGVEPALTSEPARGSEEPIMDWRGAAQRDFEVKLDAVQNSPVAEADEISEEEQDLGRLKDGLAAMHTVWYQIRWEVFCDPSPGMWPALRRVLTGFMGTGSGSTAGEYET
jgi:hypothetical protein